MQEQLTGNGINASVVVIASDFPKVPLVLDGISSRFLNRNLIIPCDVRDNRLRVIMARPWDMDVIDALSVATGHDIDVCSADENLIKDYLDKFFGKEATVNKIIENIGVGDASFDFKEEYDEDVDHLKGLASEAPIIKLVNLLITRAIEGRASDIHIEPFDNELKVRYRIDGVLHDVESAPKKLQPAIISRVKIMAKLNIAERRLPQDGRIKLKIAAKEIDIRVSTIPVLYGESIVMRLLDKESIVIDLHRLGFPAELLNTFNGLIKKPHGIILVTGPTGSGKTTTLYGALDKINTEDKKIITVEDPVEYHLNGVNQIQVKQQIGLSFANTLRHIVRQDPDIIMIGEVRDLETAEIAIQSALTGHLVFSTLHTNDAPSAITRLIDMGVENFLLSSTLRGLLAQRLVRMICPHCKEPDDTLATPEELAMIGLGAEARLFRGRGCDNCSHTGFLGRTGIFELMTIDHDVRKLIMANADSAQLRNAARHAGMKTLLESGKDKVSRGMTTIAEILRVTQEV
ncbi:MAG: type II secretion system ATPase GspE [Candidatus Magnetobacterium sp. LHC-1]|uniref:protein-secreting ATPase n=1 Tax=Candidatus Magnetobacterium casense TaxID=1455061 RepID=A0ABS6S185_9BACT|nr:type II secretion system ATPase GspE [Candidatus Magnetobacterium casensis]MBF0608916.1 type II secretion system ATPase GspE [Nitrospirota bacterium]MBV6342617.1 type II secretion system ATPase GspE [Candidatus Magnetobacterium casensis]